METDPEEDFLQHFVRKTDFVRIILHFYGLILSEENKIHFLLNMSHSLSTDIVGSEKDIKINVVTC